MGDFGTSLPGGNCSRRRPPPGVVAPGGHPNTAVRNDDAHPSPAAIAGAGDRRFALFAALSGTAYALTITGADVRNGSLTGADIRNRSLTQSDLRGRSLKGTLMLKDSVGYNAVKEEVLDASKFKKVKSAESADSIAGVSVRRFDALESRPGGSAGLATTGPFTITARCRVDGADHVAEIVIQRTRTAPPWMA